MDNVKPLYTCKKCGNVHGMGIENKETGSFEPIDICYDCLWMGTCVPFEGPVFEEWGGTMHANIEGRMQNMADYLNKQQAALINKMAEEQSENIPSLLITHPMPQEIKDIFTPKSDKEPK